MTWKRIVQPAAVAVAAVTLAACGAVPQPQAPVEGATLEQPSPPSEEDEASPAPDGGGASEPEREGTTPDRSQPAPESEDDGGTPWHLLPEDDRPSAEAFQPDCDRASVEIVAC